MSRAKNIMVQGTMSGVGKSLLAAALCRIFRQEGLRVAPFKSQNMANNSFVTRQGLELGRAQALQAWAAGVEPDVRMNPILLKPSSDTGSQVVVRGLALGEMHARDYFRKKRELFPLVLESYEALAAEHDVLVIEGAGSPAEINLRENDIVNMGLAEAVDAPVLLAADIDRGGVFAQLYGTVALLSPQEQNRVRGLIINKFRGDVGLLEPGLREIEARTGKPVAGVVPWLEIDLEDEDSLSPRFLETQGSGPLEVCAVRLPHISNFTDLQPLAEHPAFRVRYAQTPQQLGRPDLVILPGTKSTLADLAWLREQGMEPAIRAFAAEGGAVLGLCGGYQMLGECLEDPEGVEGAIPAAAGLGLLPLTTRFAPGKVLRQCQGQGAAGLLAGAAVSGYEIHAGRSRVTGGEPLLRLWAGEEGLEEGCVQGTVQGSYLHGLFDTVEAGNALAKAVGARRGLAVPLANESLAQRRERELDRLAASVRGALDMKLINDILERRR